MSAVFRELQLAAESLSGLVQFFVDPALSQTSGMSGIRCAQRSFENLVVTGGLKVHLQASRACARKQRLCSDAEVCPTYRCLFEDERRCAVYEPSPVVTSNVACAVGEVLASP